MSDAPPGMWSCPCGYAFGVMQRRCFKCGRAAPSESDALASEVSADFATWLCELAPMTAEEIEEAREVTGE